VNNAVYRTRQIERKTSLNYIQSTKNQNTVSLRSHTHYCATAATGCHEIPHRVHSAHHAEI